MNIFDQLKQHVLASRLMSLVAIILLLLSVSLTVRMTQLQQDLRQRAAPSCQANVGADCGNNGKSCCSGLACVPKEHGNGGKCQFSSPPVEPTPTTPTYYVPTTPPGGGSQNQQEEPGVTTVPPIGGPASNPASVPCGPNGCGWSPRPEGEKSTTEAPGVAVCTMSFSGPKQLIGTRLSATSIRLNWWPTPGGADKQMIQYGLASGVPQWGLMNLGGSQGQVIIDHLPANKTIWAQVRAYRGNCYEDTGWVSVGSTFQAQQRAAVVQPTVVPSPTIIVHPTSISKNSTSYFASSTPEIQEEPAYLNWLIVLGLLLLIGFIFRRFLFLLFFKRRRKKKEEDTP